MKEKIDKRKKYTFDLEAIWERIEAGESQSDIARSIGCAVSRLNEVLNSQDNAERSARAREASAEAWLDKGLEVVASALHKDAGIDASAARAYEQACARRAAVRNPLYRDKVDMTQKISGEVTITTGVPESNAAG